MIRTVKHNYSLTVINFCDEKFEKTRQLCSRSAIEKGEADFVIEYSPEMIDSEFKARNFDILSTKRGAGLWLWKPYFIKKTLNSMKDGDYLFYTDAGVIFIKSIKLIIQATQEYNQDIIPFALPLIESEWTKKECFDAVFGNTSGGGNYLRTNQILATYIIIRNSEQSRRFIDEWLYLMQDKRCCWPQNITTAENPNNYIEHRDDQSVFSLLCKKYGLSAFKDPSQFGERPYQYAWREAYKGKWGKYSYKPLKNRNSRYPKILISVRSDPDPTGFVKKDKVISLLWKLGIYNKWTYKLKNKASYKILT